MICNSGLLITRKLKELVTGGDFSPSKRPAPPVKTINLKPISAEPVHGCNDIISPGEQTRLRPIGSGGHYDEVPRPNPPVGSVVGGDLDPRVGHPAGWNEHQRKIQMYESWASKRGGDSFENPNLVCGTLNQPRVPSNPHFSSLSRPGKSEPEFTKINGKTVRLYSSLPRPGPGRGRHTHYPPPPPLTPISPLASASAAASPPYNVHETHQVPRAPPPTPSPQESSTKNQVFLYEESPLPHSPNYVALSDIYAELPRKKKKPCTSMDCTSVHHKHDLSSSSASQKTSSNDTESNKKFSTLDNSNSKKNKVLQKFHSLDRGWKSLVSARSNSNSSKSSSKSSSGKDSSSSNKTLSCRGSHTSLGYNTSISSNDGGSELSMSTEGTTYTPKNHLKQQQQQQSNSSTKVTSTSPAIEPKTSESQRSANDDDDGDRRFPNRSSISRLRQEVEEAVHRNR
ncbi:histone-lysine N-methyltransferase SETD2-like [Macrobrachium nipponense]|uniref:histone-lysine N-methyltransferase SETD2-like n=1 Tax=Macrobrachium nipponense TaxID=159736 RepID=UPI0030C83BA9